MLYLGAPLSCPTNQVLRIQYTNGARLLCTAKIPMYTGASSRRYAMAHVQYGQPPHACSILSHTTNLSLYKDTHVFKLRCNNDEASRQMLHIFIWFRYDQSSAWICYRSLPLLGMMVP